MKSLRTTLPICAVALLLLAASAVAQETDKAKLIEIEKAFATNAQPGPDTAAALKGYFYEGSLSQLTPMGTVGALPKARIVELISTPDPSDPNVKTTQEVSDFHVNIYGTTALVAYKETNTDTGHKDAVLNITYRLGCLDTFVKRNGTWLIVGNACSPSTPVSQAVWDASNKALKQEPKDIQQAYH